MVLCVRKYIWWNNWAGNVSKIGVMVIKPHTIRDIEREKGTGKGLDIYIGSAHSWNEEIYGGDGATLIDTRGFNKVLGMQGGAGGTMWVTVEGGILLKDLYEYLRKNDLGLRGIPYTRDVTLAGAISTGTHGTGEKMLSESVVSIKILGYPRAIGRGHEAFPSVLLGLGRCGFIQEITIECTKGIRILKRHIQVEEGSGSGALYIDFLKKDHGMLFWNPDTGKEILHSTSTVRGTHEPAMHTVEKDDYVKNIFASISGPLIYAVPRMKKVVAQMMIQGLIEEKIGDEYAVLSEKEKDFRYVESEVAVVWDKGREAYKDIKENIMREKVLYNNVLLLVCRKVFPDSALLSPSRRMRNEDTAPTHSDDKVKEDISVPYIYISMIVYGPWGTWKETLGWFVQRMVRKYGGKPHWGKYTGMSLERQMSLYPKDIVEEYKKMCKVVSYM